ncbi:unnamed protein product [Nesidiocoris tenuis]|uniref:Uncharacterized protein n=1 Tax=Nesidiocoris tenuis TaxID=355587 RepID=A0A6H5GI70_9HEMI|nr:unnamed protein product [Nesidiocoris tenuis]
MHQLQDVSSALFSDSFEFESVNPSKRVWMNERESYRCTSQSSILTLDASRCHASCVR